MTLPVTRRDRQAVALAADRERRGEAGVGAAHPVEGGEDSSTVALAGRAGLGESGAGGVEDLAVRAESLLAVGQERVEVG